MTGLVSSGQLWLPAQRWWQENRPEWDIVSSSMEGELGLLGEVKWSERPFTAKEVRQLARALLTRERPPTVPKEAKYVLVLPDVEQGVQVPDGICLVTGDDILAATLEK